MTTFISRILPRLAGLTHRPWPLSTAVAPQIDPRKRVEEEKTPLYNPDLFYPARLGEVLNNRYQIATKLGYGSNSTIWLARDLDQCVTLGEFPMAIADCPRWCWLHDRYVALKMNACFPRSRTGTVRAERDTLQRISAGNPRHAGYPYVRHLLDSFEIENRSRKCLILAFEPLREPLWIYRQRYVGDTVPSNIAKKMFRMILLGLDYLHSECRVIHTDLKPDNILVKLEDPSLLDESVKDEYQHPLSQKNNPDGRTIYLSRNDYGVPRKTLGNIQITDFDLAVSGDNPTTGCIQAEVYRAPEVVLGAGYSYSADIWDLGVMLWDVLEGQKLFKDIHPVDASEDGDMNHLANITSLLGPPPKGLLDKGEKTLHFYESGALKGSTVDSTNFNFENSLTKLKGEDKRMFIEFAKRMVKWQPEERSTAKELLQDPWLYATFE